MSKKIYTFLFSLILIISSVAEMQSQGTQMPTPPQVYCWSSGSVVFGYWFTAPVDMWIVQAQNPTGCISGDQSIEIYRLNNNPSGYCAYTYYNDMYYSYMSYKIYPLWRVSGISSTGPVAINQGKDRNGATIQNIPVSAGDRIAVFTGYRNGPYTIYFSTYYYTSVYYTNIAGNSVQMRPSSLYTPYPWDNWGNYATMYGYCSYYLGRGNIWYILPVYITAVQAPNGTIAPAGQKGPYQPGTNVNLDYTVTPNPGYHIVDVTINGASVGSITRPVHTQHFGVVNTNQTITAVFGHRIIATGYGAYMNPTGNNYYAAGTNPSYTTTPFPGATISSITAVGSVSGTINIPVLNGGQGQTIALGQPGYPFANLNQDWTLDVICVMNLFTSVGPHGTINPLGSTDIIWGTQQPVVITPDMNYKVHQLLVDGFDVLDPTQPGYPKPQLDFSAYPVITYTIDMSYSHTIHATFYAWQITPEVVGIGGSINPPDPVKVYEHSQYPFEIIPDLDYHIDSVKAINLQNGQITLLGNIPQHGNMSIMFKDIVNDWKLQAMFTIDRYNVIVKNSRILEGGKIFPTGTLDNSSDDGLIIANSGTDINFTIKPDVGWIIKDVLLDGVSQGVISNLPLTTIRADHEVEAQFQKIGYSITASAGNHGTITFDGWEQPVPSDGVYQVFYGDNARFIITPDHGYKIDQVMIDGASVNPEPEHSFYYITDNHTITASFVPTNRYTITASAGTGGTINPSGAVSVVEGDNQTFTWTPNAGYEISDVLIDGNSAGKITDYTFTNVSGDHTIEILFNPIVTLGIQCELVSMQLVSGQPFDVTITCVDQSNQQPVNPPAPVNVTISAAAGSQGTLSGTLQGTIPTNDNKVTISGIIYTNNSGESNVQLNVSSPGMQDCIITGNFIASEPSMQDGNIQFDNVSSYFNKDGSTALSQVTISWTNGDGNKRLVLMKATDPIGTPDLPVDGKGYQPNSIYGSGDQVGNAYAIFNDAGNSLTVTGLIEGALYYVRVFGFNGNADLANYNTSEGTDNPSSFLVSGTDETYTGSGFQVTNISPNPAYLDIKFDFTVFSASAYTIEVVDLQGRVVASYCNKKYMQEGNYPVAIPVSKLSSGSYILKIYNGTDFAYQVFTIVR
ncbi:MAG: T9SS type A sorting domain-containing protein [Bacteroidetes bacterium]|nr:MAG: T9SS type A sorting domain-containing protein [Bacteroidota bacterium]